MCLFHRPTAAIGSVTLRKQYIKIPSFPKWSNEPFCTKNRHCGAFCPYIRIIRILYYNRILPPLTADTDIFFVRSARLLRALRR